MYAHICMHEKICAHIITCVLHVRVCTNMHTHTHWFLCGPGGSDFRLNKRSLSHTAGAKHLETVALGWVSVSTAPRRQTLAQRAARTSRPIHIPQHWGSRKCREGRGCWLSSQCSCSLPKVWGCPESTQAACSQAQVNLGSCPFPVPQPRTQHRPTPDIATTQGSPRELVS